MEIRETDLEYASDIPYGHTILIKDALLAAIDAMASYGTDDDHRAIIALLYSKAARDQAQAFDRFERERQKAKK